MKKITIVLALLLLFCLCGCGSQTGKNGSAADTATESQPAGDTGTAGAGLANPVVPSTAGEISSKLGFTFGVPDGAENVSYNIISESLAEMSFTLNGLELNARIRQAKEYTDISGMYYEWTAESDCKIGNTDGKTMRYKGDTESADVCLWFDKENSTMYSLSASVPDANGLDGFDITAIAQQIGK